MLRYVICSTGRGRSSRPRVSALRSVVPITCTTVCGGEQQSHRGTAQALHRLLILQVAVPDRHPVRRMLVALRADNHRRPLATFSLRLALHLLEAFRAQSETTRLEDEGGEVVRAVRAVAAHVERSHAVGVPQSTKGIKSHMAHEASDGRPACQQEGCAEWRADEEQYVLHELAGARAVVQHAAPSEVGGVEQQKRCPSVLTW
mmetsp:Transcript_20463/g.52080  ORF Transcript_20463/g.52080 Transcript_20463/m.52080 type:complete len:203 (+) Transcript_20463:966-1574(+)